jgi:ATPase subunit of ABC transporter with duplicated ATPase domains
VSFTPCATLVASHLRVERNGRPVLDDVSVRLAPGKVLGVIGPNGVGKSTLLQVLAGRLSAEGGTVTTDPPGAVVGLLDQEVGLGVPETISQYLARRLSVHRAEEDLAAAADAVGRHEPGALGRYTEALERYEGLGAADFERRTAAALAQVGLPTSCADRPVGQLSGGQRARVALASLVLSRFAVTLLDEPTNGLDFAGLELLEAFVRRSRGPVVVVSHDRSFLEHCVTEVLELDGHDHRGRRFAGGWSSFLRERLVARDHAEKAFTRYETQRRGLEDRARRERQWATVGARRERRRVADPDRAQRGFRVERTESLAARAAMTERARSRLAPVAKPFEDWQLRYEIAEAPRAGAVVARLEHAVVTRGTFVLGPIDLEISWGERLAVTGANGSGKTTLLTALSGRLPLTTGRRLLGPSVVVGQLDQDRLASGRGASTLVEVAAQTSATIEDARSLLAKFGLGAEEVARPPGALSPGQRTRAQLALFQARAVNFLLLDEPTNHLDLPAIEQLEWALSRFHGTLLVVTHDRSLLESLALHRRLDMTVL